MQDPNLGLTLTIRGVEADTKDTCFACGSTKGIYRSVHRVDEGQNPPNGMLPPTVLLEPEVCSNVDFEDGSKSIWIGVACQDCCLSGELDSLCLLQDMYFYQSLLKDKARPVHTLLADFIAQIRKHPQGRLCEDLVK